MYTSTDRVLASFSRNVKDADASESDLIEWIGEALGFLRLPQIQEEAIAFLTVKDYHAEIPRGFYSVIQIGRDVRWSEFEEKESCGCEPEEVVKELEKEKPCGCNPVITDCQGNVILGEERKYLRPNFDLKWEYQPFITGSFYKHNYRPVRLANSTLFGTLVCKENKNIYIGNEDEYTIVGTTDLRLRFSFEKGRVVMAYYRAAIDAESGYPLIPDDSICIVAITYYLKWKLAERLSWSGRQGFTSEAEIAEQHWLKYVKQYKNIVKMPKTLDDFEDLKDISLRMFHPNRYYNFFGKFKNSY